MQDTNRSISKTSRIKGSLYGMFIADALAMPVHWYYSRARLYRDHGHVTEYRSPQNPHPDSILWRSSYTAPNAKGEILHGQAKYWGRTGVHYHQFLTAGENTLNLRVARLLIESLNHHGQYEQPDFVDRYVNFMTTPSSHNDTYVEEYHRHWFGNFARGIPPGRCAVPEKHISGLIGMVPILLAYIDFPQRARRVALDHLALTHPGPRMAAAGEVFMELLQPVLQGIPLKAVLESVLAQHHHDLLRHPIKNWAAKADDQVVGRAISSACYVEDAIPAVAFLALKYHDDLESALVSNTNLGGDNAGRGAVLGALLGAANGFEAIPERWISGLKVPPPMVRTVF